MMPEVRAFEFAAALFAVLIGLAVVDLATSFHRLLRVSSKVHWDPLALMGATYALCLVVAMWFDIWGVRHFDATRNFLFYLCFIAQFLILFLLAAASLPDDARDGIDLRDYYASTRRYFWSLVASFQALYVGIGLYFMHSEYGRMSHQLFLFLNILMFLPLIISLVLVFTKSRLIHYVGLSLLFVVMLVHYAPGSIS